MLLGCAACCLIAVGYVATLYAWRTPGFRQHPTTIKWRMIGALTSCLWAWIPAQLLLLSKRSQGVTAGRQRDAPLLQLLGLHPADSTLLLALLLPVGMAATLFLGPLMYAALLAWERCRLGLGWRAALPPRLQLLRDWVVAPATEEWCFRCCMVPLLWLEGASTGFIIATTPLFFGLCHLHHAWELLTKHQWPWRHVLLTVSFQFAYTSLFGAFATWAFIATGRPPILLHAFCNVMGFPAFADMAAHRRSCLLLSATAAGILGFAWLLHEAARRRLTDSSTYLQG